MVDLEDHPGVVLQPAAEAEVDLQPLEGRPEGFRQAHRLLQAVQGRRVEPVRLHHPPPVIAGRLAGVPRMVESSSMKRRARSTARRKGPGSCFRTRRSRTSPAVRRPRLSAPSWPSSPEAAWRTSRRPSMGSHVAGPARRSGASVRCRAPIDAGRQSARGASLLEGASPLKEVGIELVQLGPGRPSPCRRAGSSASISWPRKRPGSPSLASSSARIPTCPTVTR